MVSDWKLSDFFEDYERLLIALDGEELSKLINDPLLNNHLTARQRYRFSAINVPSAAGAADFVRFLEATRSVALIEAVVLYFAKDLHGRDLLRQDNPLVKRLMIEPNPQPITNLEQRRSLNSAAIHIAGSEGKLPRASTPDAIAKRTGRNPINSRINLNDYISNRDKLLSILNEGLLDSMVHHVSFNRLLTDRQRLDFSRRGQNSGARFLRFLDAMQSPTLLEAFIAQLSSDPIGKEVLNMDNPAVQRVCCNVSAENLSGSDQPTRTTDVDRDNETSTPVAGVANHDRKTATPVVEAAKPILAPVDLLASWIAIPQESPKRSDPVPSSQLGEESKKSAEISTPSFLPKFPNPVSQNQPTSYTLVKDVEFKGARVILTRAHTLYYDEPSSSCSLEFNIVFQPSKARITKACITMRFLPLASGQQPTILDIRPNSSQQWPTGPSVEVFASKWKTIGLTVGNSPYVTGQASVDHAYQVNSTSTSILTAAGVATSKLTIVLKESQAGDGIIYSFSFGTTLDLLSQGKPAIAMQLAVSWHLAGSWFPGMRPLLNQTLSFDAGSQVDGPAPDTLILE